LSYAGICDVRILPRYLDEVNHHLLPCKHPFTAKVKNNRSISWLTKEGISNLRLESIDQG